MMVGGKVVLIIGYGEVSSDTVLFTAGYNGATYSLGWQRVLFCTEGDGSYLFCG